jgi:hypothetical protein
MQHKKNRGSIEHPSEAADGIDAGDTTVTDSGIPDVLEDVDGMTVLPASDPALGLTNVADRPAEDWAANTGPTRTAEASRKGVSSELSEQSKTPSGRRVDFRK